MFKRLFFLLCLVFLIACSKEESLEDFFHFIMKKSEGKGNYSLIYKEEDVIHQDDAIVIYTIKNGKQIWSSYFQKVGDKWTISDGRGAEWDTPHQWSVSTKNIYSGPISDNSIEEVYVGDSKAKIITVDNNKRFWFAIYNSNDAKVKIVKNDGTEQVIDQIDQELLIEWDK